MDLTEWQGPWGEQSSCVCVSLTDDSTRFYVLEIILERKQCWQHVLRSWGIVSDVVVYTLHASVALKEELIISSGVSEKVYRIDKIKMILYTHLKSIFIVRTFSNIFFYVP